MTASEAQIMRRRQRQHVVLSRMYRTLAEYNRERGIISRIPELARLSEWHNTRATALREILMQNRKTAGGLG